MQGAIASEDGALRELEPTVQYVVSEHLRLYGGAVERGDLEQEARIGALEAIRHFRTDGGASLRTYAAIAMRQRCLNARRSARPRGFRADLRAAVPDIYSLDTLLLCSDGSEAAEAYADVIPGPYDTVAEAIERVSGAEVRRLVRMTLEPMPRLLHALALRFGLWGHSERTEREVGEALGVSQMHAHRIVEQGLRRLREAAGEFPWE